MRERQSGGSAHRDKQQLVELQSVFMSVWGDQPHLSCFLSVLEQALELGFGWVALAVHRGKARGVVWRLEQKARDPNPLSAVERRRFRCRDAESAADALILDGVRSGPLEVPQDASVRRKGETLGADDRAQKLAGKVKRWLGEAAEWSLVRGATAAFVCSVRDRRVVWVGVHVAAVPRPWIDIPRPKRRRPASSAQNGPCAG